jgi:hypothetical protein
VLQAARLDPPLLPSHRHHSQFCIAIYQIQNANKEKLERTFFGLVSGRVASPSKAYESCLQYSYFTEDNEKNDNWIHLLGGYTWLPDPDLGPLEVVEPPVFHPAAPEEIDLFMESSLPAESESAGETEHKPDAASTDPSIVGAWSGTYEYRRGLQSDGLVNLSITETRGDGTFEGSGGAE